MDVVDRKISELIHPDYNPRYISEQDFSQLKKSLKKFEAVEPAVINTFEGRENVIVGGNQRIRAAEALGWNVYPCYHVSLTQGEESELNIRLNKNTGSWDFDKLANEFDVGELLDWGFDESELSCFGDVDSEPGLTDDDEVPEVPEEPKTKQGDLYALGEHRLMCGDSTNVLHVERLMDGEKADMVFTDPPYGVSAVSKSGVLKERYKDDILGDQDTVAAIDSFNMCLSLKIDKMVFWGANYYTECLPSSGCWLVWDKNNGGSDQTDCELAWTNFKGAVRKYEKASEKTNRVHPTQKPCELIEWVFSRWEGGKIIFDLFGGSGSTLIACEKTKRKCRMMELDPHYCDVIVKRWEDYTGRKARLAGN